MFELCISHGKLDDGNTECVLELLTCSGTENEWLEVDSVWFIGNIVCLDKVELWIFSSELDETVKKLKDNLLDELLTGFNAENVQNGFEWLIRGVINVKDQVESWPFRSEPDEVVRKLDGKVDAGK